MTAFMNKVSGFRTFNLDALDATNVTASTADFCFDASQIPIGFGVSSSDNHTFNFSQGASYLVIGAGSWQYLGSTSNRRSLLYNWVNKDTSTAIGKIGQNNWGYVGDYYYIPVYYTRYSTLYIDSSTIPVGGLNLGLSYVGVNGGAGSVTLNSTDWDFNIGSLNTTTANQYTGKPTMMVFKSVG